MKTHIQPSSIHGLGLFAQQFIGEGQTIGRLEGFYVKRDGPHVLWLEDDRGFLVTNDMKYINHSPQPNAAYYDDLTVVALKDIQPGEEITHDYTGEAEELCDNDFEPFEPDLAA